MAEVKKLSASKISTYTNCSMSYFLKYVEHKKVPTNVKFVFGKAIHYMSELFYKNNFKTADTFAGRWNHYWSILISGDNLKGKQKENLKIIEYPTKNGSVKVGDHVDLGNQDPVGLFFGYMKLGQNILKKFYNKHLIEKKENDSGRKPPFRMELGFGIKKTEPFFINGHQIQGYIDRIDEKNGKFWISDYKTDKSFPDDFVLHRNVQFSIYSLAFREIFNEKEEAVLYYHLRSGNIFKTHRSQKDYDYVKKILDEVANGIIKDNFVPMYGFKCKFCDYKIHCEDYTLDYHGGPKINLEGRIKEAERFTDWDEDLFGWEDTGQ